MNTPLPATFSWETLAIVLAFVVLAGILAWATMPKENQDFPTRWSKFFIYSFAFYVSPVFFMAVLIWFILPGQFKTPWVALGLGAIAHWILVM